MKSAIYLLALLPNTFALNLERRAACNRDNCLRAVQATASPVSSSRVTTDCSSYQRATSYPSAVTITTTSGSVSTTIFPASLTTNTVVAPSDIPAYAQTACSSGNAIASRFSSACSCAGVVPTTVNAPAATVTVVQPAPVNNYQTCNNPFQQPEPSFDGHFCDSNPNTNLGNCVCYTTNAVDGPNYCAKNTWPCGNLCDSNANCLTTEVCVIGTYCSSKTNGNCVARSYFDSCASRSAPAMLFKREGATIIGGLPVTPQ